MTTKEKIQFKDEDEEEIYKDFIEEYKTSISAGNLKTNFELESLSKQSADHRLNMYRKNKPNMYRGNKSNGDRL